MTSLQPKAKRSPDLAQAKWRDSGLTDEQAKTLRLRYLSGPEVGKLSPVFHRVGALFIPYFDELGAPTKFFRIRYLEPLPGFAGVARKPQRYAQAPGTVNEVYMPPILPWPWRDVNADANVPIYITEGELKSAAACSIGLPCIGLGGVDVWRSKKHGLDMLPALKDINWHGRQVIIVYDSDAATNDNVVRAQIQLAKALGNLGALPGIVSLPCTPDGDKQGLDDFFVARGPDALTAKLQEVEPFKEASALWEMNEDVVYIRDPGFVVERSTGQRISPSGFIQHAFANRHYEEQQVTKKGVVPVKKPLPPRWIQWEHRFELQKLTYKPGFPQVTADNEWNQWPGWGCDPVPGDISPWKWLLDFLFRTAEPGIRDWFEQWCAYPIQHPGVKMYTSVVVWGRVQGTGKTLIAETLKRIYGRNYRLIRNKELKNGFNEWAENKQFVYGDEITSGDKRVDCDWLKTLITQEEVTINAKYIPSFVIPDCIAYYFTSNHPDAFFVEDTDRRYFIHEVEGGPADKAFYESYDKWLRGSGPSHLFHHLLTLDLSKFDPKGHAPLTFSKSRMIYDSKSDLAIWCVALREDPARMLAPMGEHVAKDCDLFTPTQLHLCYDPDRKTSTTINGLSRMLRSSGYYQVNKGLPVATAVGVQRLYAVRNQEKWLNESPMACRKHFDSFFGTRAQQKF